MAFVYAMLSHAAFANGVVDADPPTLAEVVVLGTAPARLFDLAKSASVIDAAEIRRATTTNITDLIARETGVNLLSYFGNDKFGGVDMRGMGASAANNVLVMIDGLPINAPDLQGADFASLPITGLQRIEIVRGANSARFGDGAVGGVINLITQPVTGEEPTRIRVDLGSYQALNRSLFTSRRFGQFAAQFGATRFNTEGYRANSGLEKSDFALRLAYRPNQSITSEVRVDRHTDAYGLPGPLPAAVLDSANPSDRRATNTPNDGGETYDTRLALRLTRNSAAHGQLKLGARYRKRENPFLIGYSDLIPETAQSGRLDEETTLGFIDYQNDAKVAGHPVTLGLGSRVQSTRYARYENGVDILDRSSIQSGDFIELNVFGFLETAITEQAALELAWRLDRRDLQRQSQRLVERCDQTTEIERRPLVVEIGGVEVVVPGQFIEVSVPVEINCRAVSDISARRDATWTNQAIDFGLTWRWTETLNTYVNFAQSFRNPNVDELTLSAPNLGPQHSNQLELGVKYAQGRVFSAELALFGMRTRDEILFSFDPSTSLGSNRNLDALVQRTGIEVTLNARPTSKLSGTFNLALLDARLLDSDARLPLTPRYTLNAGLAYALPGGLRAELRGRRVGQRLDGNDLPNGQWDALKPYSVFDLRVDYALAPATFSASLNNLTNSIYTTIAYSGTVYPMPERNFQLGFHLEI